MQEDFFLESYIPIQPSVLSVLSSLDYLMLSLVSEVLLVMFYMYSRTTLCQTYVPIPF